MAIAFVQQKAEQGTTAAAFFTSTAMTVSASNAIVTCAAGSTPSITSLVASDSRSDAFALAIFKNAVDGGALSIYVAPVLVGGSTTFTATPSANCFLSISAQEYAGIATTSPSEATNSAGSTTGTAMSPGAVNPASANDLYVSCWTHNGSASQAFTFNVSGEGWNQRSNQTSTTNQPLGSQDLISTGSKTGSATLASSSTWVAAVATFKAAAAVTPIDWYTQRPVYPDRYRKADIVPSGSMPGRGL